jgi:hypothetical protein
VNATHINKLFMFIGVVTIIIAANTWLSSQGGKAIFSIALIEEERPAMAFMGLILVGFSFVSSLDLVGYIHIDLGRNA